MNNDFTAFFIGGPKCGTIETMPYPTNWIIVPTLEDCWCTVKNYYVLDRHNEHAGNYMYTGKEWPDEHTDY